MGFFFGTVSLIIGTAIAFGAGIVAHMQARKFVRSRLRYVDAAHRRRSPWLAGVVAGLVMLPIAALVPFVGAGAVLAVAFGVGTGVSAGSKEVRLTTYRMD